MKSIWRRDFMKQVAGASLGLAAGCATAPKAGARRPNLVFVFADQWRRQSLGFRNEDPVHTPVLDRFAREGMSFDNAISCTPACSPYRATLLTGRYPAQHGVTENDQRLPETELCFAEVLKQRGYHTGFIGKWHLDGGDRMGFTPPGPRRQGFDFWYANECFHDHFRLHYFRDTPEPITGDGWQPEHETDVAINYIREHRGGPFALFMAWAPPHSIDNHPGPDLSNNQWHFKAPERFEALYRGKDLPRRKNVPGNSAYEDLPGYWGACTSLDENFGRLLKCLDEEGLSEDTIVVFTSDHGEMLGSHGKMAKGIWYEESIGIPFIIRWPGRVPVGTNGMLFSNVHVMPSLLGLMGLDVPDTVTGEDYSAAFRGRPVDEPGSAWLGVFALGRAHQRWGWRGLRTKDHTYTLYLGDGVRHESLYDLGNDPYQQHPRSESNGDNMPLDNGLYDQLTTWLEYTGDPWLEKLKRG